MAEVGSTNFQPVMFDMDLFGYKKVTHTSTSKEVPGTCFATTEASSLRSSAELAEPTCWDNFLPSGGCGGVMTGEPTPMSSFCPNMAERYL